MSKERKSLSARQYLSQLETIDETINQDLERLAEMKANAMSTGGIDYGRERVQTSAVGDKLCKDVVKYTMFDQHINDEIDHFVNAKNQIITEIRGLHNADYIKVLYKVYVQFKSLKIAATEMKRSYNYVLDVHKKALKAFEEMYENLTYLC